jgi:hypothetical protein
MLIVWQALHLFPVQAHSGIKKHNRNPYPDDFSGQDLNACITEEFGDLHRRSVYRPPGHEIPRIVKGNEEAHAQAFIGHGVEEIVRGYHYKKEGEQPPPALGKSWHGPERKEHDDKTR